MTKFGPEQVDYSLLRSLGGANRVVYQCRRCAFWQGPPAKDCEQMAPCQIVNSYRTDGMVVACAGCLLWTPIKNGNIIRSRIISFFDPITKIKNRLPWGKRPIFPK